MTTSSAISRSPFLNYTKTIEDENLALLYLRRDIQIPIILNAQDRDDEGYHEGKVANTRFGSFPHSTLIGVRWGSQIRASTVDTGSRGRGKRNQKRKLDDEAQDSDVTKVPVRADSGFAHLIPPTPENWTTSLPHRTQVVYTHDSSYILQRLRARPGTIIIEAGAGSGSFTHAACRAVYGHGGKVLSFEFHQPRYEKLQAELQAHKLDDLVELRHRDVCQDGFEGSDHKANAVFLDLPAPWLALKHLTRPGPLARDKAVRICTFSPCIEQVQRTVGDMRNLGWVDIEMVEITARRFEVRRDRVGHQEEGLKGVNSNAASVDEAVSRLAEIQKRMIHGDDEERVTKQCRLAKIKEAQTGRKLHIEGYLTHRSEIEAKLHTSYLVFAILPMEWSEDDEVKAQNQVIPDPKKEKGKKQIRRELRAKDEANGNAE